MYLAEHPTKANGYYTRDLLTLAGPVENPRVPGVREGEFHPQILPYRRRTSLELSEAILALYAAGVSTRAISRFLEGIYGAFSSPQSIFRLTQVVEEVQVFAGTALGRGVRGRVLGKHLPSPSGGGRPPRSWCTSPWA